MKKAALARLVPKESKKRLSTGTKWALWILRLIIGAIFVVSGVAKDIDLWGFVFKIEEYLQVWNVHVPRSLVVTGSFLLSATEFLCGVFVMTGSYRRSALWVMMAMMAFMLPLTFYIMIASPVSDCGCFGDFMHISNVATFAKNVVITAALVYMLPRNGRLDGIYRPGVQWIVTVICGFYALTVGLIGYNVQPMIDFRSFAAGTVLTPSDDDADEEVEFEFVYERGSQRRTFTADDLPDSTWTFVDRRMINGKNIASRTELTVTDADGTDATADAFPNEGEQLTIVLPQYARADASYTYTVNELQRLIERRGGRLIEIAAIPEDKIDEWADISMATYPIYIADETTLKEFSRGTMSVVYTSDGIVRWKRNLWSVPPAIVNPEESDTQAVIDALTPWGAHDFARISLILVTLILLLAAADRADVLRHIVRQERRRKAAEAKSAEN